MNNFQIPDWLAKIFAPGTNFYALLNEQSMKTMEGVEALSVWINAGAPGRCQSVRDCEHQADTMVLSLQSKLVDSFVTPFDREDIYDLSARLDEVINAAKSTVREIEALEIATDNALLKEMVVTIVDGARCLSQSFAHLQHNLERASDEAYLARKSENRANKVYRLAVKQLFALDDFKTIQKTKEVYRCLIAIASRIDEVGAKLIHVIIKMR